MNSSRPYLVRALIEWITDSQMTPYIAIAVDSENNKYVVDLFRERISPDKQPQKIIDMYKKYNINNIHYNIA